jgi:hypothetical protein
VSHTAVALVVFLCVFGSALVGLFLRDVLPSHHLSEESIGVIKLATGLIATMAALVLGLLVSSAKVSFDTESSDLVHNAATIISLDRVLANYGPETQEIRASIKRSYAASIQILDSGDVRQLAKLGSPEAVRQTEDFQRELQELTPHNPVQGRLQTSALQIVDEVFSQRWLALLQAQPSIPKSLLVVLVAWLSVIFGAFGLFAPRNGTIIAAFVVCALSTAGAIFLIEELSTPLYGIARVSVAPMRNALAHLGEP